MGNEIWKDIKGYEGLYQVSNFGNVKSLDRVVEHKKLGKYKLQGKLNKKYINYKGYEEVTLYKNNINKRIFVHRLVAIHFIENFNLYKNQINHKDFNKLNNHVNNLEWVDNRENQCYKNINKTSKYIGVSYCKERNKYISVITINKKRYFIGRFNSEQEAKKQYNLFCKKMNIDNKYNI